MWGLRVVSGVGCKEPLVVFGAVTISPSVAWKRGPGGKDVWIATRTQALGSGFRVLR